MKTPFNGSLIMHATCVDINGSGVLIVGRSGSGKSSLAINLLALGSVSYTHLTLPTKRIV